MKASLFVSLLSLSCCHPRQVPVGVSVPWPARQSNPIVVDRARDSYAANSIPSKGVADAINAARDYVIRPDASADKVRSLLMQRDKLQSAPNAAKKKEEADELFRILQQGD